MTFVIGLLKLRFVKKLLRKTRSVSKISSDFSRPNNILLPTQMVLKSIDLSSITLTRGHGPKIRPEVHKKKKQIIPLRKNPLKTRVVTNFRHHVYLSENLVKQSSAQQTCNNQDISLSILLSRQDIPLPIYSCPDSSRMGTNPTYQPKISRNLTPSHSPIKYCNQGERKRET